MGIAEGKDCPNKTGAAVEKTGAPGITRTLQFFSRRPVLGQAGAADHRPWAASATFAFGLWAGRGERATPELPRPERLKMKTCEKTFDGEKLGHGGRAINRAAQIKTGAAEEQKLDQNPDPKTGLPVPPAQFSFETSYCTAREARSEERRVGKECRSRGPPYH